jgi:fructosamine-3-kinase
VDAAGKGPNFFIKSGYAGDASMLKAEFEGVKAMYDTKTIRVPKPVATGLVGGQSYAVFEYLVMGRPKGEAAAQEMGRALARMHQCTSANGMFGFHIDNTIGATPQPNKWTDSWADFWDEVRIVCLKIVVTLWCLWPTQTMQCCNLSVLQVHAITYVWSMPPCICGK